MVLMSSKMMARRKHEVVCFVNWLAVMTVTVKICELDKFFSKKVLKIKYRGSVSNPIRAVDGSDSDQI